MDGVEEGEEVINGGSESGSKVGREAVEQIGEEIDVVVHGCLDLVHCLVDLVHFSLSHRLESQRERRHRSDLYDG